MRPPAVVKLGLAFIGIQAVWELMGILLRQARGQALRRREGLHPRERALEGDPRRADPHRDLCRDHRRRAGLPLVDPADGDRPAAHLRRLAHGDDRPAAARRARRQRHRPPAEQPHRLHEPDLALHLLEHELPHRAPHVPDGALPRAAAAARAGEGRLSAAEHLDPRRLHRDVPRGEAAADATRNTTSAASCRRRPSPTATNSTTSSSPADRASTCARNRPSPTCAR